MHTGTRNLIVRIITIVVGVVALLVLYGWFLDIEFLKRIHPGLVAMNPMTAIGFLLLSVGIYLDAIHLDEHYKRAIRTLGAAAALIGLTKLIDIIFGSNIGIDQLLFESKLVGVADTLPNRMAPNTALNLLLLGVILFLSMIKKDWAIKINRVAVLATLVLALLAVTGYFFNFAALYVVTHHIPMAIHTAFCFLLLSVALIIAHSKWNILNQFNNKGIFYLWFKNLPIRLKLYFGFGSLLIILLILSLFTFVSLKNVLDKQLPLRANIRNLKIEMVEMRVAEEQFLNQDVKDIHNAVFFEEGTSVAVDNWERHYRSFLTDLSAIKKYEQDELPDTEAFLFDENLEVIIADYRETFLKIVERYYRRGFAEFGLEGEMIQNARTLETYIKNDLSQYILFLNMRRAEKNFFLTNEIMHIELFDTYARQLRNKMAPGSEELTLLENYIAQFHAISEIDKEIGLSEDEGLRGELLTQIVRAEPILEKAVKQVLGLTEASINRLLRLSVLLTIISILLGLGIAYLVGRLIIQSLFVISKGVEELAKGNLSFKVPSLARDEIGLLADSFNKMGQQIQSSYNTIQESKAKDEAILESIGDGVIVTDEEGRVLIINHAAQIMLKVSDLEVLGKNISGFWDMADQNSDLIPEEKRPIQKLLKTKKGTSAVFQYIRRDKSSFFASIVASPVRLEGKIVGAIEVFRDITKEQEVDKAKTEFVSLASHQLRTPLSSINWYAEMLLAGDAGQLSGDQRKFLDEIYTSNQRMVELVNALLNVSRVDLGTFSVDPVPTDLVKMSKEIIKGLEGQIVTRKIKVTEQYDVELPLVNADIKLMRIVIENLLSNAIKYTPEGGDVGIAIKKSARKFVIEIKDTGYGIPKAQQGKIFTKLFRADNVRQKETEGTGLGLYLVKAIVEQSGGTIKFESVEDKGTTFFVSLPLIGMSKKSGAKELS